MTRIAIFVTVVIIVLAVLLALALDVSVSRVLVLAPAIVVMSVLRPRSRCCSVVPRGVASRRPPRSLSAVLRRSRTGVPYVTCVNSHSASGIRIRMHPCEAE